MSGYLGPYQFTIINKSNKIGYKDVVVYVTYYGESGTELAKRREIVYKQVKPKSKVRVSDLNTGFIDQQAKAARVTIGAADSY